jgi:hypothetical protein
MQEHSQPETSPNAIDHRFSRTISSLVGLRNFALSQRWEHACQAFIPTFSDAHLATGMALLIAGFTQLCRLTIYHFHTLFYLAWMAFSIYLLTPSCAAVTFEVGPTYSNGVFLR